MSEIKRYLDGFILGIFRKNKYIASIGVLIFTFDTKDEECNLVNRALFLYFRVDKKWKIYLFWFIKFEGEIN